MPADLSGFDAVLLGDTQLARPLSDGPRLVQLTRGHHVDVDPVALAAAGVTVAGASPVLAPFVARHSLGLALATANDNGPRGKQQRDAITAPLQEGAMPLAGMNVGIVGLGRTGRAAAELFRLVGATVIFNDLRTPVHGAAEGLRRSSLDLLLSRSDIVSLHAQWGPTSDPLIGERELRLMSRGSVLVNAADSRLTDLQALSAEVETGRIRAALDADLPPEAEAAATLHTPYVAARSAEADEKVAEFVVANVTAALSGAQPDGLLDIVDFPPAGDPAFWSTNMWRQPPA